MIIYSKCSTLSSAGSARKRLTYASNAIKLFLLSKDMPDILENTEKAATLITKIYSMTGTKINLNQRRKLKKIRRENIKIVYRDNSWDIFISSKLIYLF